MTQHQPLKINTHPPPSATSTEFGEDDNKNNNNNNELYDPPTPSSITISSPSAWTSSRAPSSPHQSKRWGTPYSSLTTTLASIIILIFSIITATIFFSKEQNLTSSSPPPLSSSGILSLPRWKEDAIPTPGKTYIITALRLPNNSRRRAMTEPPANPDQPHHRKAITLVNGQLELLELNIANLTSGCWNWKCVTKDGWLGFRNVASGTYLGHNGNLEVIARAPHHKAWEVFCARRVSYADEDENESGGGKEGVERAGYVLLLKHWETLRWLDVSVTLDAGREMQKWYLAGTENAAVWGFVEVGQHDG
ncbi:hypothetical protein QBC41DRAFT_324776 [Cercophora samala]|uniref:Uncharacterized protein n=1 Tax=Cercophora samala TaxID=330535 RepID=A0AA40DAP8_9PEZI|nr:hypothetical protein QBC41DRAFT_324776 [Cercophora samala]